MKPESCFGRDKKSIAKIGPNSEASISREIGAVEINSFIRLIHNPCARNQVRNHSPICIRQIEDGISEDTDFLEICTL